MSNYDIVVRAVLCIIPAVVVYWFLGSMLRSLFQRTGRITGTDFSDEPLFQLFWPITVSVEIALIVLGIGGSVFMSVVSEVILIAAAIAVAIYRFMLKVGEAGDSMGYYLYHLPETVRHFLGLSKET